MNSGGDAAEQVVRISLDGFEVAARLTGSAAKETAALLIMALREEGKTKGRARLTNMIRSGKQLKVFAIPQKDLKKFTEHARQYGVLYTVLRQKKSRDENAPVDIIAREDDAPKIQRILDRFVTGCVDKAKIVSEAERDVEERKEVQREESRPRDRGEVEVHSYQEIRDLQNPIGAKTDSGLPSRQDSGRSGPADGDPGRGETKPSVREKLARYKQKNQAAERGMDREQLHTVPEFLTGSFFQGGSGQQNQRKEREK